MTRKLSLCVLLLLSADYVTTASGLMPGQEAVAADFTGKIRRIRIRRKRVGSSFKVVVRSGDSGGEEAGGVKVSFEALDGGPAIAAVSMATPRTQRITYAAEATLDADETYSFTSAFSVGETDYSLSIEGLTVGGPWIEDKTADGLLGLRVRLGEDGTVYLNGALDRDHDGSVLDDIGDIVATSPVKLITGSAIKGGVLGGSSGKTVSMGSPAITADSERRVAALDSGGEDPTGYTYAVTTTLLDPEGRAVDTLSEQITFTDEGEDDGIQKIRLSEDRKGRARAATLTSSLRGDVAALEVQLTDSDGEMMIDAYDTEPVSTERWFQVGGLSFEGGEDPTDSAYLVLVDMYDSGGSIVGDQQEFEVSVDGLEARTAPNGDGLPSNTVATFSGPLLFGTIESEDDGTYTVFVASAAEEVELVESVSLTFEEPFDGPPPTSTELTLPLALEWKKWVQKGDLGLPDDAASLSVTVVSDEGAVLDSAAATTSGSGVAYRADGATGASKYGDILIDGVPLIFD